MREEEEKEVNLETSKYRTVSRETSNPLYAAFLRMIGFILFFIIFFSIFEISLFSFHPILNIFIFGFLMIDGILKARQMNSTPSEKNKILMKHIYIQLISLFLSILSFSISFFHKLLNHQNHFQSFHSKLGLLTFIFLLMNSIIGLSIHLGLTKGKFKDQHVWIANLCIYFGLLTILFGLFTDYILNIIYKFNLILSILSILIIAILLIWPTITFKKE